MAEPTELELIESGPIATPNDAAPPPGLIDQEREALSRLEVLAAERARDEHETEKTFRLRHAEELQWYEATKNRIVTVARADTQNTKTKYQAVRDQAEQTAQAETQAVQAEYDEARRKVNARAQAAKNSAKKNQEETRWQALAVFEAGKDAAIKQFQQHEAQAKESALRLDDARFHDAPVLARLRRFLPSDPPLEVAAAEEPITALSTALDALDEQIKPLANLRLPRLLAPGVFVLPFLIVAGGLAYAIGQRVGWGPGAGIAVGIAAVLGIGSWLGLARLARRSVARLYPSYAESLARAEANLAAARPWAKAVHEARKNEVEARREREARAADELGASRMAEADARRERELRELETIYPARLQAILDKKNDALRDADAFYPARLQEIQERFQRETAQLEQSYAQKQATTRQLHDDAWSALEARWRDGLAEIGGMADDVQRVAAEQFLDWSAPSLDLDVWQPPTRVPDGLRFGEFTIDQSDIPQGVPTDPRLRAHGPTRLDLPALLPFPRQGSVLIKAADAGKAEAVKLLQTLMVRYATSIPPGKVRFTIIDPVGLGENFAAFMHLADYSELLVNSRIWTETPHIEQRLADLSAHMENVIQKYLRNEFETIEEYNVHAGEVAEPFRILVVANFPTNFSESAARRLVSIASSGARCGVYTLISLDTKQTLPTGIQLKDLEPHCVNFFWRDGKLNWREPQFGRFPLTYDSPPENDRFTRLMHQVGELARDANRVEVPFDFIAPPAERYWTFDSRSGIDVPLGRAGATKLQHLKLGKGTSQHVLIAGKTGSGKSTLLHALITNTALRYSPDEVELYLIDFKKGVEFKVYAALELPHARVIAVESEREFGLSVLQRLDAELKVRGDRFRDLGVQDLAAYREATGGKPPLPRILLIVDEFQEFFVEDDKIAQEVSLLLDRLVRQGRAFGIHVHLGSQTLSGAYSLARSTLGQMAVRIALQCSESDAHLILSEENSAARLLTRPGEAIYNDANGLVEGNNPFQVVWLSDERREDYLRTIRELAEARHRPPASQIVFEGNLPAVPAKNHLLAALLQQPGWPEPPKAEYVWLGEAIAIKDPTAAVMRPQSGSNLLIIGQNDAAAVGIVSMSVLSLAAQHDPNGVRFYLLDGTPADSPLAGQIVSVTSLVPHEVRSVSMREVGSVLTELAAEVERRQRTADLSEEPTIYVVVHDLQRFRDLRKQEDDFGFGRYGEEKATPPSKLFANLLKDGPALGVHTIAWCDSLNNLNRTFDRQSLREFEMRVLFQMSANDSSTLIDSPVASRLGPNRALYFSEEEGRLEKFRPYGLPTETWLETVRNALSARPVPPRRPAPQPPSSLNAEPTEPQPPDLGSDFPPPSAPETF
ncbi:MAG: FtsK/SpoIIIE domain-containing protein [Isosphaeraceae bacterium]